MKNVINIILHDFRRLTASVVAIVVLLGLVVLPSVFTWFNVLSNWDPFEKESTGNIPIAVVIEDKGMEALGMKLNVGNKFTQAMQANDQISWQFPGTKSKAMEGVKSGNFYAAVVVPKDFTANILSFTKGEPKKPTVFYYENEKKNAIANKVTDTLKNLLQEKINETFINTIGQYVAEAAEAADKGGLNPNDVFSDLANKMKDLEKDLGNTISTVNAAIALSMAADELLVASENLVDSSKDTLDIGDSLLKSAEGRVSGISVNDTIKNSVKKTAKTVSSDTDTIKKDLETAQSSMSNYNSFVDKKLNKHLQRINKMKSSVDKVIKNLKKLGLTGLASRLQSISDKLGDASSRLDKLEKATEATWDKTSKELDAIIKSLGSAKTKANDIPKDLNTALDNKLATATDDALSAIAEIRASLEQSYGSLGTIGGVLNSTEKSLKQLNGGLEGTSEVLSSLKTGCDTLQKIFTGFADSDAIKDINKLKENGTEVVTGRMASPITMETKELYAVDNFGTSMTSFYTTVALWVGALLAAVMIKTQVKRKGALQGVGMVAEFFGRYRLFVWVGLAQALLMSVGTLFFVGIDCAHPLLFTLASCVIGITFTLMIYSLVFAFESIGLAITVVLLIVQVAGGGGTFPVQVLPKIFQVMYPFMPMHYGMDALRESIHGTYGHTYITCILTLLAMAAVFAIIGLLMHKPMKGLIEQVEKSKEESGIML